MATSSTASKSKKPSSTQTAAKPKAAPKPKPVPAPIVTAQPAPAVAFAAPMVEPQKAPTKPLERVDNELQAEFAIAAMNMVIRDEERVVIRTPHDPHNEQKLYERSINGLYIVLLADSLYNLPKSIAKAIKKQIRIQELSDMTHEEFTTKNGKFIG